MAEVVRKKKKGRKETENTEQRTPTTSRFSVRKFKQTNKHLFRTQFCLKLYKLPSLGWPPKEAAGSLENGRSREEEENGGH